MDKQIPQYENQPERFDRFLEKAAKGSCKAYEILSNANQELMSTITGDPLAPYTLNLVDYEPIWDARFNQVSVPSSSTMLATRLAADQWIPLSFAARMSEGLKQPRSAYDRLWERQIVVPLEELIHDAITHASLNWTPAFAPSVVEAPSMLSYNTLDVVASMFHFALVWGALPAHGVSTPIS